MGYLDLDSEENSPLDEEVEEEVQEVHPEPDHLVESVAQEPTEQFIAPPPSYNPTLRSEPYGSQRITDPSYKSMATRPENTPTQPSQSPAPNPNNKTAATQPGTSPTNQTGKAPGAKGAASKLGGAAGEKVGQAKQAIDTVKQGAELVKAGADVAQAAAGNPMAIAKLAFKAKDLAKNLASQVSKLKDNKLVQEAVGKWLLVEALPPILIGCLILAASAFAVALVVGYFTHDQGNTPATAVANASFTIAPGQTYCPNVMTPRLNLANGRSLFLAGSSGGFSEEDPVDPSNGRLWLASAHTTGSYSPGHVTFWGNTPFLPDETPYYITSRWPYTGWNWNGSASSRGLRGLPSSGSYAGKKLIIYAPSTGKAVVGIALEAGPAPWTGVAEGKNSDTATSVTHKANTTVAAQKALWGNARIDTPPGYIGRVAGGPYTHANKGDSHSLEGALGINNPDVPIVYGFAINQSLKPGTLVTCNATGPAGGTP